MKPFSLILLFVVCGFLVCTKKNPVSPNDNNPYIYTPSKPVIISPVNGSSKADTSMLVSWTTPDSNKSELTYLIKTGSSSDTNVSIISTKGHL